MSCNICGATTPDPETCEHAAVRSNVRKFREEQFQIWRCPECRSIHATDEVDLGHYYAGYPIFAGELNWMAEVLYGNMMKRLAHGGLQPSAKILDYGCGSGAFVDYLKKQGYPEARGYDAFSEKYRDPSVLDEKYDCVVSQDVIEHVASPRELLALFDRLVQPGGIVSIGTPDAVAIDLADPETFVHTLHQPYHRHILASPALQKAGEDLGWTMVRYYPTMYNNTLFPMMNPRFVLHYARCHDDCFDLLTEPPRMNSWRFWTPVTPFYALFGYFFDRHTDIQFVFRTKVA